MPTLKLTIAYDGTRYAGWQIQRRGRRELPTIQGTLQRVLRRVLQEPVHVIGSGRTDAGVHAEGQAAHVRVRRPVEARRLLRSANALLPPDIAVLTVESAAAGFHARFDARRKRYRYRLFTGPVVPPFLRRYVHHVPARLNLAAMRREASALRGRHDFRAFARAGHGRRSARRRILAVEVTRHGPEIWVELEADGFLHTMARSVVGTLLAVGRGRLPAGTIRRLLQTGRRGHGGATAPARGLCLLRVTYGARAVSSAARRAR
jgi:tRNA pseudouridine38-40 synthase